MPKEYGTPGPRALHPDVATSKSLGRCSVLAQLLFDRLICQADDQGRLEDGPEYVKAICLPLVRATTKAVADALDELARESMLVRYTADGRDLIQLTNWWAYQGAMRWSYPSRWPAPEGWEDRISRPVTKGQVGSVPQDAEPRGSMRNGAVLAHAGASRASQPEVNRTGPDRSEPAHARNGSDVWDVSLLIEELTGRTPSPKVTEDLRADVEQLGAARVMDAIREVHAEGPGPFDPAGLVYGAHNALFPLPGSRRETPAERKERERQEYLARTRAEMAAAKAAQA